MKTNTGSMTSTCSVNFVIKLDMIANKKPINVPPRETMKNEPTARPI